MRLFVMMRPYSRNSPGNAALSIIGFVSHGFKSMTVIDISVARRPPAPMPRPGALGPIALYRALRRNGVEAWREQAFEEPYIADRNQLGGFVLLNDPELIRYVLIDNAANYPKDDLQLEKLTPAVGRGLLTADGES